MTSTQLPQITTTSGAVICIGRHGWAIISGQPTNDEAWAAFDAYWQQDKMAVAA